jgi:hypothetical protein
MRFFFFHNNFSHLQPIKDSNIDVHVIPASTNGSCSSEHVANFFGENDGGNRLETTLQDEVNMPWTLIPEMIQYEEQTSVQISLRDLTLV